MTETKSEKTSRNNRYLDFFVLNNICTHLFCTCHPSTSLPFHGRHKRVNDKRLRLNTIDILLLPLTGSIHY